MNVLLQNLRLVVVLCATSLIISIFSSVHYNSKLSELFKINQNGLEYKTLKDNWLNKESSKRQIDALTNEMGKGYFSAVVTKKEPKGDIYSVGLMVLNSSEFDAIIRRILNSTLKINKLDIINNDVGYLIDLEITL
jgi:hypothetical protein